MDCFIKKIFEKKAKNDELVHSQFQKFSKGEFNDRAMIRIKKSGEKYNLSTTSEYAKELIVNLAEKLKDRKVLVEGALVSALKLDGFEYKEKKSAIGVNKYLIENEMSGNEIVELCKRIDKAFFALSFKFDDNELKIQVKSPKSSKSAGSAKKEDEKAKIDFCKLKTNHKDIIGCFLLDEEIKDFKEIEIKHDFIIKDIIIPPELKNEKDFAKVREGALRKGEIIRKTKIDGKVIEKKAEFEC